MLVPKQQHNMMAYLFHMNSIPLKSTCSPQGAAETCSQAHLCMVDCEVFGPDHYIQSFRTKLKLYKVSSKTKPGLRIWAVS